MDITKPKSEILIPLALLESICTVKQGIIMMQQRYSITCRKKDYYGFLAADQLSQPYSFNNKKIIFDNQTYREIILTTNLISLTNYSQRVGSLMLKKFLYSIKKFDNTKLHAAAFLADSWGWPKGAIFAIGKSSEMHDLKLRFQTSIKTQ